MMSPLIEPGQQIEGAGSATLSLIEAGGVVESYGVLSVFVNAVEVGIDWHHPVDQPLGDDADVARIPGFHD